MTRVLLRLYLRPDSPLGPGKIRILEAIRDGGSISGAAREMNMGYRSAWLLVDSLNSCFKKPVVETTLGGRGGGSAVLTDFGAEVVERYRAMEKRVHRVIARDLSSLEGHLRRVPRKRAAAHSRRIRVKSPKR